MNLILEELTGGLHDPSYLLRMGLRLVAAMVVGAVIGIQRERAGKAAGMRTHMLVAMGSALFVLGGAAAQMDRDQLSRVIQGLATGIGFIGAGAIVKRREEREIEGLTTAAGIWMTAAAGSAIALGQMGLALLGTFGAWVVLALFGNIPPRRAPKGGRASQPEPPQDP